MKKEQKNIFLKNLKEGMEVNKNVFKDIAHDELQLGYLIHTELYNDVIDKYQKMDDIPEWGEKIAVIYSGYSWITLDYLLKSIFENSEILFFNTFNKIITPILIALIEEVCKDCKIKSPIIKIKEKVDENQSSSSSSTTSSDDYIYSPQQGKYIKKSGQWDKDSKGNSIHTYQGRDGALYERIYNSKGREINPNDYYG